MADATDLKSVDLKYREGSNPFSSTNMLCYFNRQKSGLINRISTRLVRNLGSSPRHSTIIKAQRTENNLCAFLKKNKTT